MDRHPFVDEAVRYARAALQEHRPRLFGRLGWLGRHVHCRCRACGKQCPCDARRDAAETLARLKWWWVEVGR